jgi:5-(carboxyamino)imidazole ribonucleotide synthase
VTFEFENIPATAISVLAATAVHPSERILRICQNRILEKDFINSLGIGTAPYRTVRSEQDLIDAVKALGTPCILKTAELGYDGKGQSTLREGDDTQAAWERMGKAEAVLEAFVPFTLEISVIVARNADGEAAIYIPVQNIHRHHILYQTIAPAPITQELSDKAQEVALQIAAALELIGILAVEMFVLPDGALLVNELAPRPHNSGHWTIDACITSQFEQTIRAICGLPLGSPERLCNAMMTNLIGDEVERWQNEAKDKFSRLHLYGKKEIRPGRKMGHVTRLIPFPDQQP